MTDTKELESLASRMQARGATVRLCYGADGRLAYIYITGVKGVGPRPMSPLSAAERMREWLYNAEKAA